MLHSKRLVFAPEAKDRSQNNQYILGTRRFTKMNTDLSCASCIQFHLGTDVRYHSVPKCTLLNAYFKIAINWKELAGSNSRQQRNNYQKLRWWVAI